MKLHLATVGRPKQLYAQLGRQEYVKRLGRYHDVRVTHVADKYATSTAKLRQTAGQAYLVALAIDGERQFSSPDLAEFLGQRTREGGEVCFMVGGPDGLPGPLAVAAHLRWSFGQLTLPHDLAMVVLAEALYRASTITTGHPYHHA